MLTSVLSSLVAEEAASMSGGIMSAGFTSSLPMFSQEKWPKLEKLMPAPDVRNSDTANTAHIPPIQQQASTAPFATSTSLQPLSQSSQRQVPFPLLPSPPFPPNQPTNQYVQSAGMMVGVTPFGFCSAGLPLPPPLASHISMGLAWPGPQPPQQLQPRQAQQQSADGGFHRPPGIGFYGQSHQPTSPPVPWQ